MIKLDWSLDDDAALTANYGVIPTIQLAQKFGRSLSSVQNRAYKLRLEFGTTRFVKGKPAGRYWSADEIQILNECHGKGFNSMHMVKLGLLNRKPENIFEKKKRLGLKWQKREHRLPFRNDLLAEDEKRVCEEYTNGLSTTLLGLKYQTNPEQIRKILVDNGIARRPYRLSRTRDPGKQTLHNLYCVKKLSTIEIGKIYGVAGGTVGNWLKSYSIEIKPIKIPPGCYDAHGNLLRSRNELKIAMLLDKMNLEYAYEGVKVGLWRCDFFVPPRLVIEVAGWKGKKLDQSYQERLQRKTKAFVELGFDVILFYPHVQPISSLKEMILEKRNRGIETD
jgi:transposase